MRSGIIFEATAGSAVFAVCKTYHRPIEIHGADIPASGQFSNKLSVTGNDRVVSAFELWRASEVVIRRRLQQRNPQRRRRPLKHVEQVLISFGVDIKKCGIDLLVGGVVHPHHESCDAGFIPDNVARQAFVHELRHVQKRKRKADVVSGR